MISYDSYENKIKKVARVKHGIHRFRFLIIGALALIVAGVSVLIALKGMFSGAILLCDKQGRPISNLSVTYGDAYSVDGQSAFMSSVKYEFAPEGSDEWTDIKPDLVGEYKVRAVSQKSFGGIAYSAPATFTIAPRRVVISVADGVSSMTYGDTPKTSLIDGAYGTPVNQLTGHAAVANELRFSYEFADDETRVAAVSVDTASVRIISGSGDDFTDCYDIETEAKAVQLYSRNLTIDTEPFTAEYRGEPVSFEQGATLKTLVEGDAVTFKAKINGFDDGEMPVNADTYTMSVDASTVKIKTANGFDVTRFYDFEKRVNTAKLVIEKRNLIISTETKEKVYDGVSLDGGEPHIDRIVDGHEYTYDTCKQTDANRVGEDGEVETILNKPTITITDGDGNDVTRNYEFDNPENDYGTLVVKRYIFGGTSLKSSSLVYDGTAQSSKAFALDETTEHDFKEGCFKNFAYPEVTHSTMRTLAGEEDNILTFAVSDEHGADVTRNFDFSQFGAEKLIIGLRPIMISTGDFEKMYDGQSDFEEGYSVGTVVEAEGYYPLADGHRLTDVKTSHSTRVDATVNENGEIFKVDNIAEYIIKGSSNNSDFNENYDIHFTYGKLTIYPREIIVKTKSESFVYDGTAHTLPEYTASLSNERGLYTFDKENGIIVGEEEKALKNTGTIPSVREVKDGVVTNELVLTENGNYHIVDRDWGTISVEKRVVLIKAKKLKFEYDGKEHFGNEYTASYYGKNLQKEQEKGGIIEGDEKFIEIPAPVSIVNVGSINFKFSALNGDIIDRSGNYDLRTSSPTSDGSIEIITRKLLVVTADDEKEYDGTPLLNDGYTAYHADADGNIIEGDDGLIGEDKLTPKHTTKTIINVSQTQPENNVGTYRIPTVTENGTKIENYEIVKIAYGTFTITQREIEISMLDYTRAYGDNYAYTNGVYDEETGKTYKVAEGSKDVADGDSLIISFANILGHGDPTERLLVGEYGVFAGLVGLSDKSGIFNKGIEYAEEDENFSVGYCETENYKITINSCTLTVEKRKITIVIDAPGEVLVEGGISQLTYGETIYPTTFDNNAGYADGEKIVPEFIFKRDGEVISESAVRNAGEYVISLDREKSSIIRTGEEGNFIDNYKIVCNEEFFHIVPRTISIKLEDFSAIYGDGYSYFDDGRNYDTENSDELSYEDEALEIGGVGYLESGTEINPERVGEYTIYAKTLKISPYEDGEKPCAVNLEAGGFIARTKNYTVIVECGTLTISRRQIKITLKSDKKVYGDEFTYPDELNNFDEEKSDKLYYGDALTLTVKVITADGVEFDTFPVTSIPVGEHNIAAKTVQVNGEAELGVTGAVDTANYTITFVDGVLTVDPKPIEITLKSYEVIYGENYNYAVNAEAPVLDLPNGEGTQITVNTNFDDYVEYVDGRTETVYDVRKNNDGTFGGYSIIAYYIEIAGLAYYAPSALSGWNTQAVYTREDGNYEITVIFGELTFTPRPISVTTPTASWTYDGVAHYDYENYTTAFCAKSGEPLLPDEPLSREGEVSKPGLLNGDKLDVVESTIVYVTFVQPGGYKNTVRYSVKNDNYEIVDTSDEGTLTIERSEIEISLDDFSAVYGDEYDYVEVFDTTPNVSGKQPKNNDKIELVSVCYNDDKYLPNAGNYTVKVKEIKITHDNGDGTKTAWVYKFANDLEGSSKLEKVLVFDFENDAAGAWRTLDDADDNYSNYKIKASSANLEILKREISVEMLTLNGEYGDIEAITYPTNGENKNESYSSLSKLMGYSDVLEIITDRTGKNNKLSVDTYEITCTGIIVTGTAANGDNIVYNTESKSWDKEKDGETAVFQNYIFSVANTTLTVTPKEIEVELDDINATNSVIYGNALSFGTQKWTQDMVKGETLNVGVRFYEDEACTVEVTPKTAQTYYYKLAEDLCTVTEMKDGSEQNIPNGVKNYDIKCEKKSAVINRKAVTVTVAGLEEKDHTFTYGDIQKLEDVCSKIKLAAQPDLAYDDELKITAYYYHNLMHAPRDVGEYEVKVYKYTVTGKDNSDEPTSEDKIRLDPLGSSEQTENQTQNYEFTFVKGKIEIKHKTIYVYLEDYKAVYGDEYDYVKAGKNYAYIKPVNTDEGEPITLCYDGEVLTITKVGYLNGTEVEPKFVGKYDIFAKEFTISPDSKGAAYSVDLNAGKYFAQTQNYVVTFSFGELEILKREITVTLNSYDVDYGEDYKYPTDENGLNKYGIADGSYDFVAGDILSFTVLYEGDPYVNYETVRLPVKDGGYKLTADEDNFTIVDGNGDSVYENYDISWIHGKLTINKRKIIVKTPDGEWVYDGNAHSTNPEKYETFYSKDNTKSGIVDTEKLAVKLQDGVPQITQITHVWDEINGKEKNNVIVYTVGDNYEIVDYEYGTLTITQRKLDVELHKYTVEYGEDGSYATYSDDFGVYYAAIGYYNDDGTAVIKTTLKTGDVIEITTDYENGSTKIPVDTYTVKPVSYKIGEKVYDAKSAQASCDFAITFVDGEVEVTRAKALVEVQDISSIYGESYTAASKYALKESDVENKLKNDETLEFTYEYFVDGAWTDTKPVRAGTYPVRVKTVKCSTDEDAVAVTYGEDGKGAANTVNYEISITGATLTIAAREIIVQLNNYSVVYGSVYEYETVASANGEALYTIPEGTKGLVGDDSLTFTVLYAGEDYASDNPKKLTVKVGGYEITAGSMKIGSTDYTLGENGKWTAEGGDYIVTFVEGNLEITPFTVRVFFTPDSAIACAINDELDLTNRYGYNQLPYGITTTLSTVSFFPTGWKDFSINSVKVTAANGFAGSKESPEKYDAYIKLGYLGFKDGEEAVDNGNFKFEGTLVDDAYAKIGELHVGTSEVTVTITWTVNSFEYGTEGYKDTANYTVTYSGLADGEELTIVYKFVDTTTKEAFAAPKDVGTYEVQLDTENKEFVVTGEGASKNNYTFVINKTEIEITQKTIYLKVVDLTDITYGDDYSANLAFVFTDADGNEISSPLVYGDEITIDYSFSQGGEAVAKPKNAGEYLITGSNARVTAGQKKISNYNLVDIADGDLTIEAKKVTLSNLLENDEITYGDKFTVKTLTWNAGTAYDETITVTTATDYVQDNDVGNYKIFAGAVTDGRTNYGTDDNKLVWFADDGNYEITLNVATLKVNEMTLFVTLDKTDITYGDKVNIAGKYNTVDENGKVVPLTIKNYTVNGELKEDDAVRYLNKGTYPVAITLSDCEITGDKISNFKFETTAVEIGNIEIIAREITLKLAGFDGVEYGEQLEYGEDDYTVESGTLAYNETLKIAVSFFEDMGVTPVSGNKPTDAGDYYYRLDKDATTVVAGDNEGAQLQNYAISTDKEWYEATIARRQIVLALATKTVDYGATFETATAYGSDSGLKYGEIVNVVIAFSKDDSPVATADVKNVGTYGKAAASLKVGSTEYTEGDGEWTAEGGNYIFVVEDATLTINPFKLNLPDLISDDEITYGSAFTAPEYTVTKDIPYGESVVVSTATDYNTNDNAGGNYRIYASGIKVVSGTDETFYTEDDGVWTATDGNYEITLGEAKLTVNKATLTVDIFDDEIEYGYDYVVANDKKYLTVNGDEVLCADCVSDGVYTVETGFGDGDTISFTVETDRTVLSDKGDYRLYASISASEFAIDENGKYEDTNYVITFTEGKLTVKPRKVTIKATDVSFVYDEIPHGVANGYQVIGGVITANHIPVALPTNSYYETEVGDYELTESNTKIAIYNGVFEDYRNHDVTGNYEITNTVYGMMKITPRPVSVTISDIGTVYGETYGFTASVEEFDKDNETGLVAGQTLSFTYLYNGESNKPVNFGKYAVRFGTVTVDGESATTVNYNNDMTVGTAETKNYVITLNAASLDIAKRSVTIKLAEYSVVYGEDESYPEKDGKKLYTAFHDGVKEELPYGDELDFTPVIEAFAGDHRDVRTTPYSVNAPISSVQFTHNGVSVSSNYTFTVVSGELTITAKPISIVLENKEVIYGDEFVYDKNTVSVAAPYGTVTVNGVDEQITVPVSCSYTVGAAAGSTHKITASTSEVSKNYDVTVTDATLTVTERKLTFKTGSKTKEYNGTALISKDCDTVFTLVDALLEGHTAELKTGSQQLNVGSTENVITLRILDKFGSDVTASYDIKSIENGTLTVTARGITVTVSDPDGVTVTYDGTPKAFNGTVETDDEVAKKENISLAYFKYAPDGSTNYTATAPTKAGKYRVTLDEGAFNGANTNYIVETVVYDHVGFALYTVEKAQCEFALEDQTLEYGDTNYAQTVTLTNGGMSVTVTISYGNGFDEHPTVDSYTASAAACVYGTEECDIDESKSKDGKVVFSSVNYEFTIKNATLTVTRKGITVALENQTVIYGEAFVYGNSGIVTANGAYGEILTFVVSCDYMVGNVADSTHEITANALGDYANYKITVKNATLTVLHRTLTYKTGSKTEVYNGTALTSEDCETVFTLVDALLEGHTAELKTGSQQLNVGSTENVITLKILDKFGSDVTENYDIKSVENGTLSVTARALNLTVHDGAKVTYSGAAQEFDDNNVEAEAGEIVNDDELNFVCFTYNTDDGKAPVNAGVYEVTFNATAFNADAANGNYVVASVKYDGGAFATFEIEKANVSLSLGDFVGFKEKLAYGDTIPTAASRTVNGVKIDVTFTYNEEPKNVGSYSASVDKCLYNGVELSATSSDGGVKYVSDNYYISISDGTLTIEACEIEIEIADVDNWQYGYDYGTTSWQVEGKYGDDNVTVTANSTYDHTSDGGGTYSIVATAITVNGTACTLVSGVWTSADGNYKFTVVSGVLTVGKREITVTVSGGTEVIYSGAAQEFNGKVEADKAVSGGDAIVNGDIVDFNYFIYNTASGSAPVNAGSYEVRFDADAFDNENYTVTGVTYAGGGEYIAWSIAKCGVQIALADDETTYNGKAQKYKGAVTVTGAVGGDTLSVLDSMVDYYLGTQLLSGAPTNADTYTVELNTAAFEAQYTNYYVEDSSDVEAEMKVLKAQGEFSLENDSVEYGDTGYALTATLTDGGLTVKVTIGYGDEFNAQPAVDTYTASATACVYGSENCTLTDSGDGYVVFSSDNYEFTVNNATLTVTPKKITVTLEDKEVTYGDAFVYDAGTASADAPFGTVTVKGAYDEEITFVIDCDYKAGDGVESAHDITASAIGTNDNYDIVVEDATLSIKELEISVFLKPTGYSLTFGEVFGYTLYNDERAEIDGVSPALFGGDTLAYVTVKLDDEKTVTANDLSQLLAAGTYYINTTDYVEAALASGNVKNYKFKIVGNYTVTVNKAEATVKISDLADATYGDYAAGATVSENFVVLDKITVSVVIGFEGENSVTLPNVGKYSLVPVSAWGVAFEDGVCEGENVILTAASGSVEIAPKAITVIVSNVTAEYKTAPELNCSSSGLVSGDSISEASYEFYTDEACTAESKLSQQPTAVGTYYFKVDKESVEIVNGESKSMTANYEITSSVGKLTITAYTATFAGDNEEVAYGEAYEGKTVNFDDAKLGTVTIITATDYTDEDNAGEYVIYAGSVTVEGETLTQSEDDKTVWTAASGNCVVKFSAVLTVKRQTVTVKLGKEETSHVYDGNLQSYAGKITLTVGEKVIDGSDLYAVLTYDRTPIEASEVDYTVILERDEFERIYPNYTFNGEQVTGTMKIVKQVIKIELKNRTATYNGSTLTYNGLETSDLVANSPALKNALVFKLNDVETAPLNAGTYKVTFDKDSFAAKDNIDVDVSYEEDGYALFTVEKLTESFDLSDKISDKEYGDRDFVYEANFTVNGASVVVTVEYDKTPLGVDDYTAHAAKLTFAGSEIEGTETEDKKAYKFTDALGNFEFTVNNAELSITKREVTFTSGDVNVGYGTQFEEIEKKLTYSHGALAPDDKISSVSYKFYSDADCTIEASPEDAGTYYYKVDITDVTFATGNGANYKFTANAGKLSILKSQITVALDGTKSFTYGSFVKSNLEFKATATTFDGKKLDLSVTVNDCKVGGAETVTEVGNYAITVTLDDITVKDGEGRTLSVNDFELTSESAGQISITRAPLTVTVRDDTAAHDYSGVAQSYSGTFENGLIAIDGLVYDDTFENTFAGYSFDYKLNGKLDNHINAGDYTVTLNTNNLDKAAYINKNYNLSIVYDGGNGAKMTISRKTLTVTLGDQLIVYDPDISNYKYTEYELDGLVEKDLNTKYLKIRFTFTNGDGVTSASVTSVGEYEVSLNLDSTTVGSSNKKLDENYYVVGGESKAKFTVAPKPVEFEIKDTTVTYNGSVYSVDGEMVKSVPGEFGSLSELAKHIKFYSDEECKIPVEDGEPKNAGTYYAKYAYTGSDTTFTATAKYEGDKGYAVLTIKKAKLTFTLEGATYENDGTTYASNLDGFTATVSGTIADGATDIVTVSHNGGSTPVYGNEYTVTASLNSAYADNYEAEDATLPVTYIKGVVEVTVADGSKSFTYDGEVKTVNFVLTTKLGDTAPFGNSDVDYNYNGTIVNASKYKVMPILASTNEYLVVCVEGEVKVEKLALTSENFAYTVENSIDYDGNEHVISDIFTVTNSTGFAIEVVEKDGKTVENAGTYNFTLKITKDNVDVTDNFSFTFEEKVTVKKLKLYIGAVGKPAVPYTGQTISVDTFRILNYDATKFTISDVAAESGTDYYTFQSGKTFEIGGKTATITVTTDGILSTTMRKTVRVASVTIGDITDNFDIVTSSAGTAYPSNMFDATLSFETRELKYKFKLPADTGEFPYKGNALTEEHDFAGVDMNSLCIVESGLLEGHKVEVSLAKGLVARGEYEEWLDIKIIDTYNGNRNVTLCYDLKLSADSDKLKIAYEKLSVDIAADKSGLDAAIESFKNGVIDSTYFSLRADGLYEVNSVTVEGASGEYHLIPIASGDNFTFVLTVPSSSMLYTYEVSEITCNGTEASYACVLTTNSVGYIVNVLALKPNLYITVKNTTGLQVGDELTVENYQLEVVGALAISGGTASSVKLTVVEVDGDGDNYKVSVSVTSATGGNQINSYTVKLTQENFKI